MINTDFSRFQKFTKQWVARYGKTGLFIKKKECILEFKPEIMALSETKIMKDKPPTFDVKIPGYEAVKGGTSLFISDKLDSFQRKDLEKKLYLAKKLESTFAEIKLKGKKNIVVGCVYKHTLMSIYEFNEFLEPLLDKISSENKSIYLLGDFNIGLLKIDDEKNWELY